VWRFPAEHLRGAQWWLTTFAPAGELQIGWAASAMLAQVAAEEIVYRALLLRALEGYMSPIRALVLQALVFELVHAFVYGYGLSGIPFVGGVVLGYAFQRTRSLAVPTLLHTGHNLLYFTLVWYFNNG
jgi:membrane protease YdiL (CAAX protease family)